MRKLLALVLVSYLATFWAPFIVMADDDASETETSSETDTVVQGTDEELNNAIVAPKMCPSGKTIEYGTLDAAGKKATYEAFYETYQAAMSKAQCGAEESESDEKTCKENLAKKCGETGSYNEKYLEKGDCSAAGLVVTELTEVFAPNTELGDDGQNKIITTYAGLCCFAGEVKNGEVVTCDDTRTLYTKTYTDCTAVAVNCEKRQWVIGDSGIGIVQLMIKQIYVFGAFAVGSIAVSTMIFQGIKISVSGVSGDISEAKTKILQALSGIVLLFLSGLILYTINPDFFG